ncbi:MAG: ferrous iron transport protein A [Demequinaceae bacterium]|nr:ferrous iron transport protein A [Demequinaceae bacterium]
MLLIDLTPGVDARVTGVRASGGDSLRLTEIGLRPGEKVRVVQRAGLGGRLIALGCGRIAVDAGTARRIEVEEIP